MKLLLACSAGVAATLVAVSVASAERSARPALAVADETPVVLRGSGFKPGERVRVFLQAGEGKWTRTTEAGSAGGFTVRFPLALPGCGQPSAHAFGSEGSRARLLPARRVDRSCGPGSGLPDR